MAIENTIELLKDNVGVLMQDDSCRGIINPMKNKKSVEELIVQAIEYEYSGANGVTAKIINIKYYSYNFSYEITVEIDDGDDNQSYIFELHQAHLHE